MLMMSEIQDGLSALKDLGGFRRVLWAALLVGLSLITLESVTQYFAFNALQEKTELLNELRQIEGTKATDKQIDRIYANLIDESQLTFEYARNPGSYLLAIFVRFFQGAYLSLPVFWLFFKGIGFVVGKAKDEMNVDDNVKKMGLFLGSLVFSGAAWMATLLGAASVLWNKSDSFWVSWFVFPVISAVLLIAALVWLMVLSIFVGGAKTRARSES